MSDELKRCPFCGGFANGENTVVVTETARSGPRFGVRCYRCGGRVEFFENIADAIAAWNRRAAIADRIDAEHEKAAAGCIHYDPERHYCGVHGDTEHGWVKLPVDADGAPIRVGDVVTMQLLFGGESKPLVVDRMELSHGRDGDLWCIALDTDKECWNQPSLMRHYTPPTVEDVLDEFVARWMDTHHDDLPALKAEYAAKLRLKEDA